MFHFAESTAFDSEQVSTVADTGRSGDADPTASGVAGLGFVLTCLLLPIIWGIVIHWLFSFWRASKNEDPRQMDWPDYQI